MEKIGEEQISTLCVDEYYFIETIFPTLVKLARTHGVLHPDVYKSIMGRFI
jgi:hypothetical protein